MFSIDLCPKQMNVITTLIEAHKTMRNLAIRALSFIQAKNNKGVTAIEYGMLAALITLAIIGVIATLGGSLHDVFSNVNDKVKQ